MKRRLHHALIDQDFVVRSEALAVLDPAFWSVNLHAGPRAYHRSLEPFSRPQGLALALFWYQAEVNNGGHWQFFANPTGIVWKEALAGFDEFALPAHAAILREAVARLGGDPPLDADRRQALVDAMEHGFDDLDERFYALERRCALRAELTAWIHAHPDDFTFEGFVERP
jgi:hypothetical protein